MPFLVRKNPTKLIHQNHVLKPKEHKNLGKNAENQGGCALRFVAWGSLCDEKCHSEVEG